MQVELHLLGCMHTSNDANDAILFIKQTLYKHKIILNIGDIIIVKIKLPRLLAKLLVMASSGLKHDCQLSKGKHF